MILIRSLAPPILLSTDKILFNQIDKQAKKENKTVCWSIPRKTALPAYEKAGYIKCSDWFDEGMEFGPNWGCFEYSRWNCSNIYIRNSPFYKLKSRGMIFPL